ncbi:MAG TPA: hypothetical protein VLR54_06635 [Methanobacteriaceae archaeon]|nr:hypothetical protein [Methanobacteriaceae archaeon]
MFGCTVDPNSRIYSALPTVFIFEYLIHQYIWIYYDLPCYWHYLHSCDSIYQGKNVKRDALL